jgi:hypothetical protein
MEEPLSVDGDLRDVAEVLDRAKTALDDVPSDWSEVRIMKQSEDIYVLRVYERETEEYEGTIISF